jgi:hypothetical protein
MANTRGFARLGMLAVGLGVGAAVAHSPVASADSSTDWLSSIDSFLGGSALPAPSSGLDMAISYDGYSLVQEGNATAYTITGEDGLAIADGSGAYAYAGGGTGDVAEAEGTNALAIAGGEPGDTDANYDTAIDIGNNDLPSTAGDDGAYAGNGDLAGGTGTGAYDTAIDIGNNTNDLTEGVGGDNGAFAGAGGLSGASGDGNNDTAIDIGNNSGFGDGATADEGNGNYASESGSTVGEYNGAYSGFGDDNTVIDDVSYTTNFGGVSAEYGNDNFASVLGPENSGAVAGYGDSNIVYVVDPLGSTAISATSGYGGNSDVAAVLWTDGNALASGADHLYDIITALGPETGTF